MKVTINGNSLLNLLENRAIESINGNQKLNDFINNLRDKNKKELRNLILERKKQLLEEPLSPSRLNVFLNNKARFILSYIFGYRISNYRILSGKVLEEYLFQYLTNDNVDSIDIDAIWNPLEQEAISDENTIFIGNQEEKEKEYNDLLKTIRNNKGVFDRLKNEFTFMNRGEKLKEEGKLEGYYDFHLQDKNGNSYILEVKYSKQKKSENNLNYSNIRQASIYSYLSENTNNVILSYFYPNGNFELVIKNLERDSYIDELVNEYKKFIKNLSVKSVLFYLQNDLDSFYLNDIDRYLSILICDKLN